MIIPRHFENPQVLHENTMPNRAYYIPSDKRQGDLVEHREHSPRFLSLNGTWDFCFDDYNRGEKERWQEKFPGGLRIQVPFTYETKLSGIKEEAPHSNVWYRRSIQVDAGRLEQDNYILHFEGSDFLTKVWVNGRYVGSHRGGYARFSFDITNLVRDGENEIVVKVEDSLDVQQPRGKQRWLPESYGCFYVQTTGIWKTVWSEYVPKTHLSRVKMTPNMEDRCLEVEYEVEAPAYAWDGSRDLPGQSGMPEPDCCELRACPDEAGCDDGGPGRCGLGGAHMDAGASQSV